ncbi:MAG: ABC transporter ATP-binding protein [Anaerolineae bacterium]|nr:ABC transporter ATP-binding protein [Anaerolineae bacterium]
MAKRYNGTPAVDGLGFEVRGGSVFGLLGPNGAGKTTTMMMISGLLTPDSGQLELNGKPFNPQDIDSRHVLGVVPQDLAIYPDLNAIENLRFFGRLYGIRGSKLKAEIELGLDRAGLRAHAQKPVRSYSGGMKRRLNFAIALLHHPQVLILDEPASGLDPRARIEIRELLRELKNMGKTIFFSSHILSEVADICTEIAILEAGNLIAHGNMAEMKKQLRAHRLIQVKVIGDLAPLQEYLLQHEAVHGITPAGEADLPHDTVQFDFGGNDEALSTLLARMIGQGIPVVSFHEETGDLEDVFLQVTQG